MRLMKGMLYRCRDCKYFDRLGDDRPYCTKDREVIKSPVDAMIACSKPY